jgi:hypothetical protein
MNGRNLCSPFALISIVSIPQNSSMYVLKNLTFTKNLLKVFAMITFLVKTMALREIFAYKKYRLVNLGGYVRIQGRKRTSTLY